MLKQLYLSLAIATAIISPVMAEEYSKDKQVVDIDVTPDMICDDDSVPCRAIFRYTIFALEDNIVVNKAVVNKGECKVSPNRFNIKLEKGGYAEFTVDTDENFYLCHPTAVEVITNKGQNIFGYE